MTEKRDRVRLLETFAKALGELTTDALNDLTAENRALLARSLASGAGDIRLTVLPSPLTVIGTLHLTGGASPPTVLFRIDGDLPSSESH